MPYCSDKKIENMVIKNTYRRLSVLKSGKPVGIVSISDGYHYLFKGIEYSQ